MKAAYFREEWLDKALQLLPNPADRALFYEMLMQRAFGRQVVQCNNPVVVAMYTMAESAIAADIAKYDAKCERNRANALSKSNRSQSHPVAASGSDCTQSQPSTSTNTSTSTSTNTSSSTSSISSENSAADDEREKYLIYCTFFTRGALNIAQEFDNFYNYYAALGWKNNKGAAIVSKVSAAAMWRLQGDTCGNLAERAAWAKAFKNAPTTSPLVWTAFQTLQVEQNDTHNVLHIHVALNAKQIEALEDKCERSLRALMAHYQCTAIEYHISRA